MAPPYERYRAVTSERWSRRAPLGPGVVDDLVQRGLRGELLPAGLADQGPELRAVRSAELVLGPPAGHVHEPVPGVRGQRLVQGVLQIPGLGSHVLVDLQPKLLELVIEPGRDVEQVDQCDGHGGAPSPYARLFFYCTAVHLMHGCIVGACLCSCQPLIRSWAGERRARAGPGRPAAP